MRQQLIFLFLAYPVVVEHERLFTRVVVLGVRRGSGSGAGQLIAGKARSRAAGAAGEVEQRVLGLRIGIARLAAGVDEAVLGLAENLQIFRWLAQQTQAELTLLEVAGIIDGQTLAGTCLDERLLCARNPRVG